MTVHRFEESIDGRSYLIEVMAVSNRWRAQLRRTPGTPTALMPFYGATPDEAARQLAQWLMLAHRRTAQPSGASAAEGEHHRRDSGTSRLSHWPVTAPVTTASDD